MSAESSYERGHLLIGVSPDIVIRRRAARQSSASPATIASVIASSAPHLASLYADDELLPSRAQLLAALAFIDGATTWTRADLAEWFREHAPVLGTVAPPPSIRDSAGVSLPLDGPPSVRADRFPQMLAMTRWQVVLTLRGLLSTPAVDRFLHAAIHTGRVQRERAAWRVVVSDREPLCEIVLALFAADVLTHREFHEQNLCICDVCGRVSYDPRMTTRAGCLEHVPESDAMSGVRGRGARGG